MKKMYGTYISQRIEGKEISRYANFEEASRATGINTSHIKKVVDGESKSGKAKGYEFYKCLWKESEIPRRKLTYDEYKLYRGGTLETLSKETGISTVRLHRIFTNTFLPRKEEIKILAKAGVTLHLKDRKPYTKRVDEGRKFVKTEFEMWIYDLQLQFKERDRSTIYCYSEAQLNYAVKFFENKGVAYYCGKIANLCDFVKYDSTCEI